MSPLRQRLPKICDREYLGFIGELPCVICHTWPVQRAHVRYSEACPVCKGEGIVAWDLCPAMGQPCVDCQATGDRYGKRHCGGSEKPTDWWTVPLCDPCHLNGPQAQHSRGERDWWQAQGIDPLALCVKLQDAHNTALSRADAIEAGRRIVMEVK